MPLHRDIFWIGRQWAVLSERMHALNWLNAADFDNGLAAARKHYPEPDRQAAPSEESVSCLKEGAAAEPPKPAAETFDMRSEGLPAKFVFPWRIRHQR